MSCSAKPAGVCIAAESDDVVRLLIRHQQKRSRGIDGKVAWSIAPGGFVTNRLESTAARVDPEDRNAVVTAV